jgi:hypothetical protein
MENEQVAKFIVSTLLDIPAVSIEVRTIAYKCTEKEVLFDEIVRLKQ